ncbi:hypothetical protein DM01DRAFT_1406377 [Hesseltinella vesiculosa]|uniref:Uncharacterized protein n=1 Tax=Hesseltinella vesiculosa TaxID=101127 RepID=A0A1X2GM30_9FUNG|nr:hypothetical protein DM01DRAFT_1406377 [Hesseltinella vesiculosa]
MSENQPSDCINESASDPSSTSTIRYSKETLIALYQSPLVSKPESMPPLTTWFGEEAGSPTMAKLLLNGSLPTNQPQPQQPQQHDIKDTALYPPKTNFASSLYGGMKRSMENQYNVKASPGRIRQSEDSNRQHRRGFDKNGYHNTNNSNNNSNSNSSNNNNNKQGYVSYHNNHGNLQNNTNNNSNNHRRHNDRIAGRKEYPRPHHGRIDNTDNHVPEWMDYNPEDKNDKMKDLEAWKSSMKQKEALEKAQEEVVHTPPQDHPSTPTSIFESPDATPFGQASPGFNKVDQLFSNLDISSSLFEKSSTESNKRGSRFAKFFNKRDEEPLATKSISVNDLFQPPPPASPKRALSEEELLQSFGANRTPTSELPTMGFDKVLQILSQPKPKVHSPPQPSTESTGPSPPLAAPAVDLPAAVQEQAHQPPHHLLSQPLRPHPMSPSKADSPVIKPKFANLPTSVLRQMTRDKRSPSKSSPVLKQSHFPSPKAYPSDLASPMESGFMPPPNMSQQPRPLPPHLQPLPHPQPPFPPPMMGIPPMMSPDAIPMHMQRPFMPMPPHPQMHPNPIMHPPPFPMLHRDQPNHPWPQ